MHVIITFEEITEEFGNYEFMYVAMGTEGNNVLNKKLLNIAWDISKDFEELDQCEEVISISTLSKMFFDPSDSSIVVDDLMPNKITENNEIKEIKTYLDNNPEIKSRILSKNEDYLNIVIRPRDNHDYPFLSKAIHSITDKYKDQEDLKFHYGGQAYVTGAVPGLVAKEVNILLIFGLLLMTIILLINLRSVKGVFLILLIISLSLLSMLGFMGWVYHFTLSEAFFFTLNNISMPIVLLTIANSDGVHMISRFFKELRKKQNSENIFLLLKCHKTSS